MITRVLDFIFAAVALVILAPLFVLVALAIKWDSRGPVFFSQLRVGRNLNPFHIHKFRTMVANAAAIGKPITVAGDSRITRVGRLLRRFKIDELPQLVNVLKGEMSLVGPRPEVPRYVELHRDDYAEILRVRPGLTDLASLQFINEAEVLAFADNADREYEERILPEKIRLQKLYARHASVWLDASIVLQTLLRILGVPLVLLRIPESDPQLSRHNATAVRLTHLILRWRRPVVVLLDFCLIVAANYIAFWLRFDGAIPETETQLFLTALPWVLLIRGAGFALFGLNQGLWRYTSLWDLKNILGGVCLSSVVLAAIVYGAMGLSGYPRSILAIDSLLLIGFVTGVRLPFRLLREKSLPRGEKRVLIVGAGDTGERIVREMRTNKSFKYEPIGFIDDDISALHQRIHGVKVLGMREDLARILAEKQPDEVVLALRNAAPSVLREMISLLASFKVAIKTVPSLEELMTDKTAVSQMRNVSVDDLLPRAPIHLDTSGVRRMIAGRRVLITGAGGSIGSELSRQVARFGPEALVLYERHENSLYQISKELQDQGHAAMMTPVLGDVTDVRRLATTMASFRPHIVFHAAAHKHVPLVEQNPAEALKNNCMGTRITAETAHRFGVERFVLISTDKAVNPSSVMGATKRVAELIVQNMAQCSDTRFLTVRFGNVLGSNGSVLLRFREQIQAGGPVTVTHPEVRRYFMLIPEAVQLVLQAATLGEQGGRYILEMGEQISVLDFARTLIRLSGFIPGKEIPIQIIGLRPGEKLTEELVGDGEIAEPAPIDKIMRIRTSRPLDLSRLQDKLIALEAVAHLNRSTWVLDQLRSLVPEFQTPEMVDNSALTETLSVQ